MNQAVGAKSTARVLETLRSRLPKRRRRDAVLALEYLITASPEYFAGGHRRIEYFKTALTWLRAKHGAENVLSAAIHLDESTPHMVAYVVPITADGRLAAKDFVGGPKRLSQLQTEFHEGVGKPFGLVRGTQGSKASHKAVRQFYSGLSAPPELPKPGLLEVLSESVGHPSRRAVARRHAETQLRLRAMPAVAESFSALRTQALSAAADLDRARAESAQRQTVIVSLKQQLRDQAATHQEETQRISTELSVARVALRQAEALILSLKTLLGRAIGWRRPAPALELHPGPPPLPRPEIRR